MARQPRMQLAGGRYHITAHCNPGRKLFREDAERQQFLALFQKVVASRAWSCSAYCLLDTHYHLLVETRAGDLALGMQYLNGRYAQWANWFRRTRGHLFDARYHAVLVGDDGHRAELHRYIALNPVRASLVARPEDWPWSSYAALLELTLPPPFLDVHAALLDFGASADEGRAQLRAFVNDAPMSPASNLDQYRQAP